jgi:accessory gene regulator B
VRSLRELIKKVANHISKVNGYSEDQEEQVNYALRVIIFEALKIIGVIIIFSLMGYPAYAIIAIGTMISSKPFIGGYHEDSQIKCFISTLLIIGSIIYLSVNVEINFISKLILSGISLYCIWNQAPIINPIMDITRTELIRRNRSIGIIVCIILVMISLIFNKSYIISNTIVWTIVFQALLMFNKRDLLL